MVKQTKKKTQTFSDEWKDLRVKTSTAKQLMLYKVYNDLITYDQAILLLLQEVGAKK
jgi:hypothetical protein